MSERYVVEVDDTQPFPHMRFQSQADAHPLVVGSKWRVICVVDSYQEAVRVCDLAMERQMFRVQRDDARRQVCDMLEGSGFQTKEQIAQERGWDCFNPVCRWHDV